MLRERNALSVTDECYFMYIGVCAQGTTKAFFLLCMCHPLAYEVFSQATPVAQRKHGSENTRVFCFQHLFTGSAYACRVKSTQVHCYTKIACNAYTTNWYRGGFAFFERL